MIFQLSIGINMSILGARREASAGADAPRGYSSRAAVLASLLSGMSWFFFLQRIYLYGVLWRAAHMGLQEEKGLW